MQTMPQGAGQSPENGLLVAASAERNKGPILAVLERVLPPAAVVLEIASGTGQHVVHFAKALPALEWQPSDPDAASRESIRCWVRAENLRNVREPVALDVCSIPWPVTRAGAIVCINMIHIAPWAATEALFAGAQDALGPGGALVLYGPFRRSGRHTAPSNAAFDAQLRATNAAWGVRDLEVVTDVAGHAGFALADVIEMPANNLSVVFRREPARASSPLTGGPATP